MLSFMTAGRGVPEYVNAYLREWVVSEWIAKGRSQKELAAELQVTPTTVSEFKSGNRGAGYELFAGLARIMGRSREDIEREAMVRWKASGPASDDPFPNRRAALEFLRDDVPREVADRARSIVLDKIGRAHV